MQIKLHKTSNAKAYPPIMISQKWIMHRKPTVLNLKSHLYPGTTETVIY